MHTIRKSLKLLLQKEVYIYENPIFIHSKEKADLTDTSNRKKFDEMSAHKQYDSLKRKQKHYEQARWDIARIVDCNFDNKTKFVTLTFKRKHSGNPDN